MNISYAANILKGLSENGVQDIVLCAGARNSPFVFLIDQARHIQVWNFFEERSAAFFALGLSQKKSKPVAVITTSGTAVAELLPAAIEATYTQTPLIFITADRPRSYRGTGAPQSIDQVGLFSKYVETCFDVDIHDPLVNMSDWTMKAPIQVNVCFDEPLIDEEIPQIDFKDYPQKHFPIPEFHYDRKVTVDQPLVVVGTLKKIESDFIVPFLEKWGAPIYAEATSQLHSYPQLRHLILRAGEKIVEKSFQLGLVKSLIRIGGVPTLRFWRDLEKPFHHIRVVSLSSNDFTGLSRASSQIVGLKNIQQIQIEWQQDHRSKIKELDMELQVKVLALISKFPLSEVGLLFQLYSQIQNQNLYVGNSLPIRELDLICGLHDQSPHQVSANRGANGIDGQISTFLGLSDDQKQNWAWVGDLTAMYDLSSLWIADHLKDHLLRLVVINNGGGKIFKNIFKRDIFLNSHQIDFSHWAKMWKWQFETWETIPDQNSHSNQHLIIELKPQNQQSDLFWIEYSKI